MAAAIAVGLAAAMCVFRLRSRMAQTRGLVRLAWIFLAGSVMSVGGWGAELTALAAFHPGMSGAFDPYGVAASLMVGVAGGVASLSLAWTGRDRLRQATGAILLAFAATGMHFVAMAAYRLPAHARWEPILVWLSVVIGCGSFVAALQAAGRARSFPRQLLGVAGLTVGMLSIHFVSLAGFTVSPDGSALPAGLLDGRVVAMLAATVSALTTCAAMGAAYIDDVTSRSAAQRTRRLADAAREGIVVLSSRGAIVDCNAAFVGMTGLEAGALAGEHLAAFLTLETGGELEAGRTVEGRLRAADGAAIPVEAHARPLLEQGEEGEGQTAVAIRDLREQRAAEDHIRFLAEHDPLTGLPNRMLMNRALEQKLPGGVILCIIRIANNAETNSLYGHAAGDAVLVKTAERLKRFAASPIDAYTCMASRLGGAEMGLAIFGPPDIAAGGAFTASLTKMLRRPVLVDSHAIEPQVCVGLSAAPVDSETVPDLVRHAEVALESAARGEALEGVVYFRQDLQDELVAQRNLLQDLKVGLAEDQLVVYYQPQVTAESGRLCGFEALVRWIHPERGFMPPDSFIPAAEQSGLIIELGEQVLRKACAEAAAWAQPVSVAVNLSPLQVGQTDLPRLVHEILLETGLPPSRLELEITESALFRDYQRALDTLRRLKALGVKIAMDDFGTGFSSLSTLQSFPFDKIKIDKSFVAGMGATQRSTVIVKAVLGIGKGLDIPVVAEGVETAEQMALLRDEGCAVIQGYHIGKPAPVATHAALFEALEALEAPTTAAPVPVRRRRAAA